MLVVSTTMYDKDCLFLYSQIGFLFTMVIDGGSTAVIRMSRINPEYQGRKLQRSMFYYVAYWAVKEMGAKSIVSTEEETGPLQDNKHGRYRTRVFISWVRPSFGVVFFVVFFFFYLFIFFFFFQCRRF